MHCPLCAGHFEFVDRDRMPQILRCLQCGEGWEALRMNNGIVLAQAPSYRAPKLRAIDGGKSVAALEGRGDG